MISAISSSVCAGAGNRENGRLARMAIEVTCNTET